MGTARVETPMGLVGVGARPDLPTDTELVNTIVRSTRVLRQATEGKGPLTQTRIQVVRRAQQMLAGVEYVVDTFGYDGKKIFEEAARRIEISKNLPKRSHK